MSNDMADSKRIVISVFEKQQLEFVREYIPGHLDADLSLAALAGQAGISVYKISQGFKELFGQGIRQYIREQRMNRAKQLLMETNEPMKMIAGVCGFKNDKVFSRLFKLQVGVSPKAFRRASL